MAQLQSTAVTGSLTTTGNVGIGTTPAAYLQVYGTGIRSSVRIGGATAVAGQGRIFIEYNGDSSYIDAYSNGAYNNLGIQAKNLILNNESGGNVGIGTTNPGAPLHVNDSSADAVVRISKGASTIGNIDLVNEGNRFSIQDDGTRRLSIDVTGNVGINSTSPIQKLDIVGKMRITDDIILAQTNGRIDYDNGVTGALRFFSTSTSAERMRITSAGNVGIGTTSPTAKLEVNVGSNSLKISGRDTYVDSTEDATNANIYVTQAGVGDFGQLAGNLVLQARTQGTVYRDIIFAGGLSNGDALMTILGEGNVGIGITSPSQKLHVMGQTIVDGGVGVPSSGTLHVRQQGNTSGDGIALTSGNGVSHRIWKDADGTLNIGPSSIPSALVQTLTGNVGIGTTTLADKFQIYNGTGDAGLQLQSASQTLRIDQNSIRTTTASQLAIFTNNTVANGIYIISAGNVGIGTTTPDVKLEVNGQGAFGNNSTLTVQSDAFVTVRAQNFAGIDVASLRTSGNIGGLRAFDSTSTIKGQLLLKVDGGFEYFSGASLFYILPSGNVGINTDNPRAKLDVNGSIQVAGGNTFGIGADAASIYMSATNGAGLSGNLSGYSRNLIRTNGTNTIEIGQTGTSLISAINISGGADSGVINLKTGGDNSRLHVAINGNIGINNTSPLFRLHVLGTTGGDSTFNQGILIENSNATDGEPTLAFKVKSMADSTYWFTGLNQSANYKIAYGSSFTDVNTLFSVLNTGNVGIGLASPIRKLDVLEGNVQIIANFTNTSTTSARIKFTDANTGAENVNIGATGTKLAMWTNNTVRMTIISGGNVGIGTTNPTHLLHVNGTLRVDNLGSSPASTEGPPPEAYVGSDSYWLGRPAEWLAINVSGDPYVIPLYTP